MKNRMRAHELAGRYFAMIAEAAGVRWDDEDQKKIDRLIAAIIDAAKEEVKAEMGYYVV
jgi:hypothetical protein